MPPLPAAVGVAKVATNWGQSTANGKGVTIWHIRNGSGVVMTPADIGVLAAAFSVSGTGHPQHVLLPSVADDTTIGTTTFTDLGGTGFQQVSTVAAGLGTATSASLPWNTAICWSWHVLATWRGGKPRTYMPGVPTGALVSVGATQVSSAYASVLKTAVGTFLSNINALTLSGGSAQLGMLSYHTGGSLRPTPVFYPYNSVTIHFRLDSQRRRLGKESGYGFV